MSVLSPLRPVLLLLAAIALAAPAAFGADAAAAPAKPATTAASPDISNRLFLSFFQDAALVKSQWWEGQLAYADSSDGTPVDSVIMRGVVAFRPVKTLEVGGSVGFGTTDPARSGQPSGTGATDLQAYGKWVFPNVSQNLDLAAGLLVTIPTGDDTAGLGFNSFASEPFGSVRYRIGNVVILGSHLGICFNGDGAFQGYDLDGQVSFDVGFSALFPLASQVSIVTELQFQTARFENDNPAPNNSIGADDATQILGGINWRAFGRGMLRANVAFGLTDGAPDFSALVSYAFAF